MMFSVPIPILRSFNEAATKAFYVDFLGFTIDWEHRFEPDLPLYMQLSRGNCVVHISEHYGDAAPHGAIRIGVDDLVAYQQLLLSKNFPYARPGIVDQSWGLREMMITDPNGNRIVFTMPIPNWQPDM